LGLTVASYLPCPSGRAQRLVLRPSRAVADRGYYSGEEILACEQAGITVYLPKPMTSGINAKGSFGKQDFVLRRCRDVYLCPAGEQLTYRYTNEEDGKILRRYWTPPVRPAR